MTKKYVVLFSEAVSKTAESTARALAQSANHVVYVLHRDGEKQIADSFVRTLEIKERRQEMLKEACSVSVENREKLICLYCRREGIVPVTAKLRSGMIMKS